MSELQTWENGLPPSAQENMIAIKAITAEVGILVQTKIGRRIRMEPNW